MRMPILDDNASGSAGDNGRGQRDQPATQAASVAQHGANHVPGPVHDDSSRMHVQAPQFPILGFPAPTSWTVLRDLELNQYTLAAELLQTAKGEELPSIVCLLKTFLVMEPLCIS